MATTTDLIARFLQGQIAGGALVLPASAVPAAWSGLRRALAEALPDGALHVAGPRLTTETTAVRVEGVGGGAFAGLDVVALFSPASDQVSLQLTATGRGWGFAVAFPALAGTVLAAVTVGSDVALTLSTPQGPEWTALAFRGSVDVLPLLGRTTRLPLSTAIGVAGTISAAQRDRAPGLPELSLSSPTFGETLGLGHFTGLSLKLHLGCTAAPCSVPGGGAAVMDWYPVAVVELASVLPTLGDGPLPVTVALGQGLLELVADTSQVAAIGLSDLARWAGVPALTAPSAPDLQLPTTVGLDAVRLVFDPASLTLLQLELVVGTHGSWAVIPGLLDVDVATLTFRIAGGAVSCVLAGEVTVRNPRTGADVARFTLAAAAPRLTLFGDLDPPPALTLQALVGIFTDDVADLPDLELSALSVEVAPGDRTFALSAVLDADWPIDLGPHGVRFTGGGLELRRAPDAGLQVSALGRVVVDDALSLQASWTFPTDFRLEGRLPRVRLSDLAKKLTDEPAWLQRYDLELTDSSVVIQKDGAAFLLQLGTQVVDPALGSLALSISRVPGRPSAGGEAVGTWGLALGIDLGQTSLAALKALGLSLPPFDAHLALSQVVFVLSSVDRPALDFPAMATFGQPGRITATQIKVPVSGRGVIEGFNVYATWTLAAKGWANGLKDLLGLGVTVPFMLQVQGDDPAVVLAVAAVQGKVTKLGRSVELDASLDLALENDEVRATLAGTLDVWVHGQTLSFTVGGTLEDNGVDLMGSMIGPPVQLQVLGYRIGIADLAVQLGTDWELIPTVGFAGTFELDDLVLSGAVYVDSEWPLKSLFAASIGKCTLTTFLRFTQLFMIGLIEPVPVPLPTPLTDAIHISGVECFRVTLEAEVRALTDALDAGVMSSAIQSAFQAKGLAISGTSRDVLLIVTTRGHRWGLCDRPSLMHYSVDRVGDALVVSQDAQVVIVPDAPTSVAQTPAATFQHPTLRAQGALSGFGLRGELKLSFEMSVGLSILADVDPITIGRLFRFTGADGVGKPVFSVSTTDPGAPTAGTLVRISGQVEMLGAVRGRSSLTLTTTSFELDDQLKVFSAFDAHVVAHGELSASTLVDFDVEATLQTTFTDFLAQHARDGLKAAIAAAPAEAESARQAVVAAHRAVDAASAALALAQTAARASAQAQLDAARRAASTVQASVAAGTKTLQAALDLLAHPPFVAPWKLPAWIKEQKKLRDALAASLQGDRRRLTQAQADVEAYTRALDPAAIARAPAVQAKATALSARQHDLAAAQARAGNLGGEARGLASLATWLASNALEKLVVVEGASFRGKLSALDCGQVSLTIDCAVGDGPSRRFTVPFDFHSPDHSALAWVTGLVSEVR